jgi:hypothetical protein
MKIQKKMMKKGGEFKPHMMFDPKTGKGFKANKMADHLRMDKMGYLHEDEMKKKGKKMEHSKKSAKGMMYKKAKGGMKIQYKMQEGGKVKEDKKIYSAEEISKMSMKEIAKIMNGIVESEKAGNKDFKYKGLILGNTANTIKLIQDEVKERMRNMTPEQMEKMMGVGEGAAEAKPMGGMMKKMMAGGMMKKDNKMMMGGKMKKASYGMRLKKKSK